MDRSTGGFETSGNSEAFGKPKMSHLFMFKSLNIVSNRKPPCVIWHPHSSLVLSPPPRLANIQIPKFIFYAIVKQHQTKPLEKAQETIYILIWLKFRLAD